MDPSTIIVIIVVIVVLIAVALIYVAQRVPKDDDDPLQARLAEFSQRGEAVSLDDIELSQPFVERVIYPILRWLGEVSTHITPQYQFQEITRKLELSGKAGWIDEPMFFALHFVGAGVLGVLCAAVFFLPTAVHQELPMAILYTMIGAALGYFFPDLWLNQQISARQLEIRKAMPDALDLLTICIEAGLGFDAAMSNVAEKWENQLSLAFARTIREIQLGKTRRDALKSMAEHIDLPEMDNFVMAVIQGETGFNLARTLRMQTDTLWEDHKYELTTKFHHMQFLKTIATNIFCLGLIIWALTPIIGQLITYLKIK